MYLLSALVLCCILPFVCSCPDYRIWLLFASPFYQKPHCDCVWLYTCVLGTALGVHSLPTTWSASHAIHFTSNQIIQDRVFSLHNIFFNLAWNHNNNSHLISQGTTLKNQGSLSGSTWQHYRTCHRTKQQYPYCIIYHSYRFIRLVYRGSCWSRDVFRQLSLYGFFSFSFCFSHSSFQRCYISPALTLAATIMVLGLECFF